MHSMARPKTAPIRLNATIDPETAKRLDKLARLWGTTRSEVIRRIVRERKDAA